MWASIDKTYSQCDSVRVENSVSDNEGDISYQQTVINYSPSGKILEVTSKYQSGPGANWKVISLVTYQYDSNDSIIIHNRIDYYTQVISGSEFTYDSFGNRLTGISFYNSNINSSDTNIYDNLNHLLVRTQNSLSSRTQIQYTYDSSCKVISDLFLLWNGNSWADSIKTDYIFDVTDNLINQYSFENVGGNWDSTFIGYYNYNDSNLVDTFYTKRDSAGIWLNDTMKIYTYGPLNKRIHSYLLKWDQSQWIYLSDDVTEVDAYGYPSLTVKFRALYVSSILIWDQSDWQIEEVYDSVGTLLSISRSFPPFQNHESYQYIDGVLTSSYGESSSNMTHTDYYSNYYYSELFGDTLICQGGNPVLHVDSCSGDSFLWSTGETTSNIIVTVDGDYQVTITRANGWVVQTPPIHVTFALTMTLPNVIQGSDSSTVLCPGNSLTLSTPFENGVTYQWYTNGNVALGFDDNFINLTSNYQSGEYFLIATNNCGSDSSSITHLYSSSTTLSAYSEGTTCIACDNGKIHLNIQSNFSTYSVSITPVAGIISGDSISDLPPGIYEICVTDSLGCTICVVETVLEDPTGIASFQSENLKFYPNPVLDELIISCNQLCYGEYFISDLMGKVLLRGVLSGFKNAVDFRGLSTGVYFLTFQNVNKVTFKILKE